MKITCVASSFTHEIRYFEFTAPDGRLITSFFQVLQKPDLGIGCFDDFESAIKLLESPPFIKEAENILPLFRLMTIH